jgi:hypothetical protein
MAVARRVDRRTRAFRARRLHLIPSRQARWSDVTEAGDLRLLFHLANPLQPLARELGLFGFGMCPRATEPDAPSHRSGRLYELSLWVHRNGARCARCDYTETLDQLHARLGFRIVL